MRFMYAAAVLAAVCVAPPPSLAADTTRPTAATPSRIGLSEFRALLATDHASLLDLKLAVDSLVDPSIDAKAVRSQIDAMVETIRADLPEGASVMQRIDAIRTYLHEPSWWSGRKAFAYDLSDPYGQSARARLLSVYLDTRLGNCVSMPILLAILAERLGVEATLATAPLHMFTVVTDENGRRYNLEATSGGGVTRASHYRKLLPITDRAIRSGVYLTPLSRKQRRAAVAMTVVEHWMAKGRHAEAIRAADLLLRDYPTFVYAWVKRGTAAYHLMRREFMVPYPDPKTIPHRLRPRLLALSRINQASFSRADALGWKPPRDVGSGTAGRGTGNGN